MLYSRAISSSVTGRDCAEVQRGSINLPAEVAGEGTAGSLSQRWPELMPYPAFCCHVYPTSCTCFGELIAVRANRASQTR